MTWTEYFFDGDCYYRDVLDMPQKCPGLRKYGHDRADADPHFTGGFAEYCYVLPGTGILKLAPALTDEEATPLNCGVATMMAVTEAAAIGMGDTVVVQGLGLLGLYGVAIAVARGARLVIGLDAVPARLEMARRFGAGLTLDVGRSSGDEIVRQVREACRPDGADAVIEVCGVQDVIPLGAGHAAHGGPLRAGRPRQPRRARDDRRQRGRAQVDHAARHPQLPPAPPGAGPRLRPGQPGALPVRARSWTRVSR